MAWSAHISLTSGAVQHCRRYILWHAPSENVTSTASSSTSPSTQRDTFHPFHPVTLLCLQPTTICPWTLCGLFPYCISQHWTPCYVPVCGRCPRICTTRTHKPFFCLACTDLVAGLQPPARRRRSPATQPTCLKRQQLELHFGLQYLTGMT